MEKENINREIGRKAGSPMVDQMMSTPVASIKRFRKDEERVNPFERHLLNRLLEPVWSPSVLNYTSDVTMETPPQLSWTIDQIAKINPISIEESPSTHQNERILDPQSEAQVQAAISQFFSTSDPIAPSPINSNTSSERRSLQRQSSSPPHRLPLALQMDFSTSSSASDNSNDSLKAATGHHHPLTPNAELNTSVTRRKLDFTFDMMMDCDGGEHHHLVVDFDEDTPTSHSHASTGTDADGSHDNLPITSIIMDMENSNGKTINTPEDTSKTGGGGGGGGARVKCN